MVVVVEEWIGMRQNVRSREHKTMTHALCCGAGSTWTRLGMSMSLRHREM